jgi:signal transduction histidine kinase
VVHQLFPLFALGLNLGLLGTAIAADPRNPRNQAFAWLAAALSVWDIGAFGLRWTTDAATALQWERLLHVGVVFIPVLYCHYVLAFLDRPTRPSWLIVGYLLSTGFGLTIMSSWFMRGIRPSPWGLMPVSGPLYAPYVAYFQIYMTAGLVLLLRAHRTMQSSFRRNRALLVIGATAISVVGGVIDFLRFVLGWEDLYPVGIPASVLFSLALGVAIVRYQLVNVSAIAKRGLLYLLVTIAFAPLLVALLFMADWLTPGVRLVIALPTVLFFLALFGLGFPVLSRIDAWLTMLIFRRRRGIHDAILALTKKMSSVLDLDSLGRTLTQGLVTGIPVLHASLFLVDPRTGEARCLGSAASKAVEAATTSLPHAGALMSWLLWTKKTLLVEAAAFRGRASADVDAAVSELERQRVALLIPLTLEPEAAAILLIGEKLSGEIFDSADVDLLEVLAGQTAIALRNAGLYEDLREQMGELRRTQRQLIQSAKLAAVGELASSVAHEINNPLQVILFNAGLLLRQFPEETPARKRLTTMTSEAQRAGKITRDLLDFARRREPRQEPVRLQELIPRVLDLLQTKMKDQNIEVETVVDNGAPPVSGDRDQLMQVLLNLVVNAIDAMPDGGVLAITAEVEKPDLVVRIRDTGSGMSPSQAARIFEPFFTTKPEGRGTGLGLSVSLGIIRSHGGTIDVETEPGKGTTMTVKLPAPTASALS